MLVCNYCGRHFKHDYESCPGCGSGNFKKINDIKELVIETPPKDGYHISVEDYNKEKNIYKIVKIFLYIFLGLSILTSLAFIIPFLVVLVITILSFIGAIEIEGAETLIPILIIFVIFIASNIGFLGGEIFLFKVIVDKQKDSINNNIERANKLAKEGLLVKNMPYELVESGNSVMGKPIYCVKVDFKFENGTVLPLTSNPKYDGVDKKKNPSADLLIDKNDYSNFYIDFEIY